MFATVNPATEERVREFPDFTAAQADALLTKSVQGFNHWRLLTLGKRGDYLRNAAGLLEERIDDLKQLMVLEMGRPVSLCGDEILKCAAACRYYADHAGRYLNPEKETRLNGSAAELRFEPLGPVLAIMPWNFPFWQIFRCTVPALAAGNAIMLKPAPSAPQCALAAEKIFRDAGLPPEVFQIAFLNNEQIAEAIGDDRLRGVSITGSVAAGRAVAACAGRHLKKHVVELGGSDPFIVFPDCDLEKAAKAGAKARFFNSGQVCSAAKRFIVHRDAASEFKKYFVEAMHAEVVGDPADERTTMGPLAQQSIKAQTEKQVEGLLRAGAQTIAEVEPHQSRGYFMGPKVMKAPNALPEFANEEIFGPVAVLYEVDSEEDAIRLSNATGFGLCSAIWTEDSARVQRISRELETGMVVVRGIASSDVALPFGGTKNSGYGRELGILGTREFTYGKVIF